jgi:membrane associated rhomboid family serine protease
MRPNEVVAALSGRSTDHFPLVTIFTSIFLHGSVWHLVGNMLFLLVFGIGVETALGPARYALYYLFWGVVAAAAHIYVDPTSTVPTLGASGAIGGVLGCYFLLFPGNKIEIFVPVLAFISFMVSAWVVLGLWFLYQIFIPQNGVANWAHAGGFLAGMLTVLIMGGRSAVLKGKEASFERVDD